MNGPMPSRDCGRRSSDPRRAPRFAGAVPGVVRLARRDPAAASHIRLGHRFATFGPRSFGRQPLGQWAKVVTGFVLTGIGARSKRARRGIAGRARTFRLSALFAVDALLNRSQDATALVATWSATRPVRGAFRCAWCLHFSHRCAPSEPMSRLVAPRCQANCGPSPDAKKPATAVPGGPGGGCA